MDFLKEKRGGLPVWVWALILALIIGAVIYLRRKNTGNSNSNTSSTSPSDSNTINPNDLGMTDPLWFDPYAYTYQNPSPTNNSNENPPTNPNNPKGPTNKPVKNKNPNPTGGVPTGKKSTVIQWGNFGTPSGPPVGSSIGLSPLAAFRLEQGRAERSAGAVMN